MFFVIFYVFYNKTYFFSNKKSFYIIESKYAANYNKIKKIHSDISFIKKSKFKKVIVEPLVKAEDCPFIIAGIIKF